MNYSEIPAAGSALAVLKFLDYCMITVSAYYYSMALRADSIAMGTGRMDIPGKHIVKDLHSSLPYICKKIDAGGRPVIFV